MGGDGERDVAKRIGVKVQAAAHQEYNKARYLKEAVDRLLCGEDIFGRNARFVRVPIDESYPAYLREHQEEYAFLMAPQIGRMGIFCKKTKLLCMQGMRRVHGAAARCLGR
jgi:beta-1,4-mannosyl-glycoprotein beta-1,4-N-acetylglucosaminyltransferase